MSEPTLAQRVRLHIYEFFLEHARAPVVEELMTYFGLSRDQTVDVLNEISETRGVALVKGTARILMAWPFSGIATPTESASSEASARPHAPWRPEGC